jgi:hypothetical protein
MGRRALVLVGLAWGVPVAWAALNHRLWEGAPGESMLQHFGIHARFLVAIALMVLAEAAVDKGLHRLVAQFTLSGTVGDTARQPFKQVLAGLCRWRDHSLPWVLLLGIVLGLTLADAPDPHADDMTWALAGTGDLGFGGWWVAYVSRPIFLALLLAWVWRLGLLTLLFWRIGRLDLSLVPTHPDRVGGLGFVQALPGAFSLLSFALTVVMASHWAHGLLYHGQTLASLKLPVLAFVLIMAGALMLPLVMLAPALIKTKQRALPAYADLVGRHGRLVHSRWIDGQPVADTALLDAAEIGPVADTAAIYQAVAAMQPVPIGKRAIGSIVLPIALPLIAVVALQMPVKAVLLKLLKALV